VQVPSSIYNMIKHSSLDGSRRAPPQFSSAVGDCTTVGAGVLWPNNKQELGIGGVTMANPSSFNLHALTAMRFIKWSKWKLGVRQLIGR
jgi:hypothetical protein